MKKTIFTMLLGILTFGLVNAQTEIFNPATYTGDLGDGMEIVQIDGVSYLQVVCNGWGSMLNIPEVASIEGTHFAATVGFGQLTPTLTKNMAVQIMDTVNKVYDQWSATGLAPSNTQLALAPAVDTFQYLTAGINDSMSMAHQIQFFGQETTNWGPTVGDTIWCGRITSIDKSVLFDPASLDPATLPEGYEVVEEGGVKLLKVALAGWDRTLDIPDFTIGDFNKVKLSAKYEAGTVTNENAQIFVQPMIDGSTAAFTVTMSPAPSDLTEVETDGKMNTTIQSIQFAVQETSGDWAAVTDGFLYVGKITVSYVGNVQVDEAPIYTTVAITEETVTIDGLYDDAYGETENIVNRIALNETGADVISETSSYGVWLACADMDNFYIYIEVNDDDPIELGASTQPWMNDGVELFMDIQNRRYVGGKRIANEQHQMRLNYGTEGPAIGDYGMSAFFGDSDTTNIEFAIVSSSAGFVVEAAIPWATWYRTSDNTTAEALALVDIVDNMKLAFEVSVMDADALDGRKSILNWSNNTGKDVAYTDNEYYGEITLEGGVGVFDNKAAASLNVYPNPANSQLTIGMNNVANVQIFNIIGSKVLDKELNGSNTVNVSELNNGVYIIMATDSRGNVAVSKFNKE